MALAILSVKLSAAGFFAEATGLDLVLLAALGAFLAGAFFAAGFAEGAADFMAFLAGAFFAGVLAALLLRDDAVGIRLSITGL